MDATTRQITRYREEVAMINATQAQATEPHRGLAPEYIPIVLGTVLGTAWAIYFGLSPPAISHGSRAYPDHPTKSLNLEGSYTMTDQQPELHRFGKRTLMRLGAIQPEGAPGAKGVTQVWRDVTERVNFVSSKYQPHQGKQERARRLRQAQR